MAVLETLISDLKNVYQIDSIKNKGGRELRGGIGGLGTDCNGEWRY